MQFNSPEQLELARRVLKAYNHDWSRMLRGATYEGYGVVRLAAPPVEAPERPASATETIRTETATA